MSESAHEAYPALDELVFRLERSFDRSGAFYIGVLDNLQHAQVAELLRQELSLSNTAVHNFELHHTALHTVKQRLQQARGERKRAVLVFWSLEHISEENLQTTLGSLCSDREGWSQTIRDGEICIPTVLLVSRSIYRQYLGIYAIDLLDGVSSIFLQN